MSAISGVEALPGQPSVDPSAAAKHHRSSILALKLRTQEPPADADRPLNTKARILETAVVQFAQSGFDACTMRDLARGVGIKAPAIYNHYESKEAVLAAAIQQILGEFFASILEPLDDLPLDDWLRSIVRGHVRAQLSHPTVYPASDSLLNGPIMDRAVPPAVNRRIKSGQRSYIELLRALVQMAATDLDETDARMAAFSIAATCDRVAAWWNPKGPLDIDEIADHTWSLIERMLQPPR